MNAGAELTPFVLQRGLDLPLPRPEGSAQIEQVFEEFYTHRGLSCIAGGCLFTGAEAVKTAEETALWDGTASAA